MSSHCSYVLVGVVCVSAPIAIVVLVLITRIRGVIRTKVHRCLIFRIEIGILITRFTRQESFSVLWKRLHVVLLILTQSRVWERKISGIQWSRESLILILTPAVRFTFCCARENHLIEFIDDLRIISVYNRSCDLRYFSRLRLLIHKETHSNKHLDVLMLRYRMAKLLLSLS